MSETKQLRANGQLLRQLLITVSATALLACLAAEAEAAEGDHPIVWIEMGGGFDQISADDALWVQPNLTPSISNPNPPPFGKLPAMGLDADLKLSFTPEESDWVYSAAIRYGRAQRGHKHSHDQSYNFHSNPNIPYKYELANYDFANTVQESHSSYAIIDFQAGKDVGLGVFGSKSTLRFGVRIAQLSEKASGHFTAITGASGVFGTYYGKYSPGEVGHQAEFRVAHSFTGLGPSVAWDASTALSGSQSRGFSLDWGANAAILFGRQKASVFLRTLDEQYLLGTNYMSGVPKVLSRSTQTPKRSRTVIVPNVGGFAGLSWRLPNVKVSVGYRADLFFGAIDGGLTTSQKETREFYGPFANVSIGIGG